MQGTLISLLVWDSLVKPNHAIVSLILNKGTYFNGVSSILLAFDFHPNSREEYSIQPKAHIFI